MSEKDRILGATAENHGWQDLAKGCESEVLGRGCESQAVWINLPAATRMRHDDAAHPARSDGARACCNARKACCDGRRPGCNLTRARCKAGRANFKAGRAGC